MLINYIDLHNSNGLSMIISIGLMLTGHCSTQALQLVQAHISSRLIYVSNNAFPSSTKLPFLSIFFPTSATRSLVSIMIFRGESNFPVILAGQAEVQRPHSVQV